MKNHLPKLLSINTMLVQLLLTNQTDTYPHIRILRDCYIP